MPTLRSQTRRSFLRLASGAALSAAFPLGAEAAAGLREFTFAVVNDLHYRDERCRPWFQRVVAHLAALRPRPAFVMLAGDLAEDGKPEQLAPVRQLFSALPMPVRTVIGNHDQTEQEDRSAYEALFGRVSNYRFTQGGVQFLALDTTEGRKVYRTRIAEETLRWVEAELPSLSRSQPLVILTHFPLGANWLRPLNTRTLLERLREHHLVAAYSGHWHGIIERRVGEAQLSTGRCCSWWRDNHDGSEEKGYRLCRIAPSANRRQLTVEHRFLPVPTVGLA